jgi:hypothetical protein
MLPFMLKNKYIITTVNSGRVTDPPIQKGIHRINPLPHRNTGINHPVTLYLG